MKTKKRQHTKNHAKAEILEHDRAPLLAHLHELKRRLLIVVVSVAGGSAVAYVVEKHLINLSLQPAHDQKFIYTSPLGGINFVFTVCIYVGVALSIPIIVYQFLRFLQPMMRDTTAKFIAWASLASGIVAVLGILFGYFLGLPAALHFLLHQFKGTEQIEALLTIQSYLSFVTAYLFGAALMFQFPLILIFINRIKPLKPSMLFKYERHVIVGSLIFGFIMNPTPNLIDQMLVVIPLILMYQVGIGLIWILNRGKHTEKFYSLVSEDAAKRAERTEQAAQLTPVLNLETELERPRRWLELSDAEPGEVQRQPSESNAVSSLKTTSTTVAPVATPTTGRVRTRYQYDVMGGVVGRAGASTQSTYQQINISTTE